MWQFPAGKKESLLGYTGKTKDAELIRVAVNQPCPFSEQENNKDAKFPPNSTRTPSTLVMVIYYFLKYCLVTF